MAKSTLPEFPHVGNCTEEQIGKLLAAAFDKDGHRSRLNWDELTAISGIGYNRGWLIVERHNMILHEPTACINFDEVLKQAKQSWTDAGSKGEFDSQLVLAQVVRACMLEQHDSWGRVMVRLNMTEGQVRKAFTYQSAVKDIGLRPAQKGGRFIMDKGELYTDHRKREGAAIGVKTTRGMVREQGIEALENKGEVRLAQVQGTKALDRVMKEIEAGRIARRAARNAKRASKVTSYNANDVVGSLIALAQM